MLPHEIDRVTLFWPVMSQRGPGEPIVVLTTREAYNEVRLLKALRAEPVREDGGRHGGAGMKAMPPAMTKTADKIAPPKPAPPEFKDVPKGPRSEVEKQGQDEATFPISTTVPGEPLFYALNGGPFELLFLVDDHTVVFLPGGRDTEFAVMALLSQLMQKKGTGPLAEAIATAGNHTLAGGIYLPPLFREFERGMPRELAPYAALTAARTAVITGDLGKSAKLSLKLAFDDAAAARRAAPVLEEGLKALAERATAFAAEAKDGGRPGEKAMAPLLEAGAAGLKKATVKADGAVVTATTEVDAGPAAAKAVGELLTSLSSRKKFAERSNNLKQMGIALHSYFDANGKLPANIYGPKGELLLSWRVQLLPYLEQDNLYKQLKLNEAWDSEHNKKFIEMMPKVFEISGRVAPKGQTFYQAFRTPAAQKQPKGGPFLGRTWLVDGDKQGQTLLVPDGTSNTIAILEARTSVAWTKPDDLVFGVTLPPVGEEKAERFMALFLDGSVRAIPTKVKPDLLRLLLDGYDGTPIPDIDNDRGPRGGLGGSGEAPRPVPPPPSGGGSSSGPIEKK